MCFDATAPHHLDGRAILEANRAACAAAMAHIGAQLASVEYAGSGDSGEGEEVLVYADCGCTPTPGSWRSTASPIWPG
jgi:hypothetical protein